jgi:hypothetical protein
MIEGVMTESLRGRAAAAGTQAAGAIQTDREEVEEP